MAIEYASSPVEQAGTQIRIASPTSLFSRMCGNTVVFRASNGSRSLKKQVTLIRMSP